MVITPEMAVSNITTQLPSGDLGKGSDRKKRSNSKVIDNTSSGSSNDIDHRVTIRPRPNQAEEVYKSGIMDPLKATGGVIFPYTPMITASFSAEYASYEPAHSIQDYQAYKRTPSPQFTIQGDFTAQTEDEAAYCLAVIHFFRSVTKMYFGASDNVGVVPPVLLLNGYGEYMFNNLPIIVKDYNITLDTQIDYVKVETAGGEAWVPSKFLISTGVVVQRTPQRTREFNMSDFKSGALLTQNKFGNNKNIGGWW